MTLVGTISIFQSSDEQITATSQRATAKAFAAAEIGVARYRELIDKYKVIAVYDACETGTWTGVNCDDTNTNTSWEQAANIPNISTSCFANPATTVANMATKSWQYVDSDGDGNYDSGEIQYRLIDYTYNRTIDNQGTPLDTSDDDYNGQPFGTLVVEGRVNQDNLNQANESQAAVAQISVDLPIQPGIPTPGNDPIRLHDNFNYLNPVLWITGNNEGMTDVRGLKVNGNIVITDTDDCILDGNAPTTANLEGSLTESIFPQSIIITPLQPNNLKPVPGSNFNSLTPSQLETLSANQTSLPQSGDNSQTFADGNIYYHYVISSGNVTLNDTDLFVRAGRKVILYLDGDLTLIADSNGVDLNSRSDNNNESYYLEIYGSSNTRNITLRGDGEINIKGLIHAPEATVKIQNDPTVKIYGAVWVKDWNGDNSLTNDVLIQPDPNPSDNTLPPSPALVSQQFYNYSYVRDDLVGGTARVVDPVISSPSRWETQQAE